MWWFLDAHDFNETSSVAPSKNINVIKGGFNMQDEYTFRILLEFIKKRVEIITSQKEAMVKGKTGKNLINLIGEIMRCKTHMKLLK